MSKVQLNKEIAEEYARVKDISLEEAYRKLEENMAKEASVTLHQQVSMIMNGFRNLSPQINGVVLRESDTALKIAQLNNEVTKLTMANEDLNKRLDFERETYKKSMTLLNGIVLEDTKTLARIAALEASSVPLYKRIMNRIKCLLNN